MIDFLARRLWLALHLHAAGAGSDAALGIHVILSAEPDFTALEQCLWLLRQHGSTRETALLLLERTPADRPGNADAHWARGNALFTLQRFDQALASYDRAIALDPNHVNALVNRGCAFTRAGNDEAAVASFDQALAVAPDEFLAALNRIIALHNLHRLDEALASADRLLTVRPNDPGLHNNRAAALGSLGRLDEALASYERAHSIDPDFVDAWVNHGIALNRLGRFEEALPCIARALELLPDDANARLAAAEARLALGDFAVGWREYEWRRKTRVLASEDSGPQPHWRGEDDLAGRTILLTAEQGFGDTLQFCRYVASVSQQGRVVLKVPDCLVRLLKTLPGEGHIVGDEDPVPEVDVQCPLPSLPLAFGTTLENIPADVPYLRADPDQETRWRARLSALPGLRVGLVWAGDPRPDQIAANAVDRRRSISLAHYAPLGCIPGVSLISLQKGGPAQQTLSPPPDMTIHDWTEELNDFADTAALVTALDLVISVDTSVVHLTGALGKPVWVLNRFDACWRWFRHGTSSKWYPTARLFRQPSDGDWDSVIAEVAAALRDLSHDLLGSRQLVSHSGGNA